MLWIPIALTSHFLWAITTIGDKYLITNHLKNEYVYIALTRLLAISVVLLLPFIKIQIPGPTEALIIIFTSFLSFANAMIYIKAASMEDITRINMWWSMIPIFSFLIAWALFGEVLSTHEFISMMILVTGSFLASFHIGKSSIRFSKAFILMALACFFYAIYAVLIHHLTNTISFYSIFFWEHITVTTFSIILFSVFPSFREKLKKDFLPIKKNVILVLLMVVSMDMIAILLSTLALSKSPAALVFALEGSQAIFSFVLTMFLALFTSIQLKEEHDLKNILIKTTALILIVTGVFTLYIQ